MNYYYVSNKYMSGGIIVDNDRVVDCPPILRKRIMGRKWKHVTYMFTNILPIREKGGKGCTESPRKHGITLSKTSNGQKFLNLIKTDNKCASTGRNKLKQEGTDAQFTLIKE